MKAENLFEYLRLEITKINMKYPDVCGITPTSLCSNVTSWRQPGVGCCHDCKHHTIETGCSTVNLTCMVWYCDLLKDKFELYDWITLRSLKIVLSAMGIKVRDTKEQQMQAIEQYEYSGNESIEDLYEVFYKILS